MVNRINNLPSDVKLLRILSLFGEVSLNVWSKIIFLVVPNLSVWYQVLDGIGLPVTIKWIQNSYFVSGFSNLILGAANFKKKKIVNI